MGAGGSDETRAATTRLMNNFGTGIDSLEIFCQSIMRSMPATQFEQYNSLLHNDEKMMMVIQDMQRDMMSMRREMMSMRMMYGPMPPQRLPQSIEQTTTH